MTKMDIQKDLFLSAIKGDIEKFEKLTEAGGDFKSKDSDGISMERFIAMLGNK